MAPLSEGVIVMSEGASSVWYERPEALVALAQRDTCAMYRLLQRDGVSQREIARRTGQSQSEVSDIVQGRAVRDVTVLERIGHGLGIPLAYLRLIERDGSAGAYPDGGTVTDTPEEVEEMHRRVLLAAAGITVAGRPVDKLGELLELPGPAPVPLPARIEGVHVAKVRNLTRRLGEAGHPMLADPDVLSAATAGAEQLLGVPGAEPVTRALRVAVAELHIEAAWAGFDAWRHDRAAHHFTTALQLATEAGDTYLQALILYYAGRTTREHGHPNDGLKLLQLGLVKALDIPDGEPRAVVVGFTGRAAVRAAGHADAARALADLGHLDLAEAEMATAHELWTPTDADHYGDLAGQAAQLALHQGELDAAEPLAAASVRRWEGLSLLGHAQSSIVLATVHVRAGEPSGLPLAHNAITAVGKLSSIRARKHLQPLTAALTARPGQNTRDLAHMTPSITTSSTT